MAAKTLSETLEEEITSQLVTLQGNPGRDSIRDRIVDTVHPDRSEIFELVQHASARMDKIHDVLKQARANGRLYPWIIPAAAALLFEGVFEACVGVWLMAGDPADKKELNPAVKEFVRVEVKLYSAMVGA